MSATNGHDTVRKALEAITERRSRHGGPLEEFVLAELAELNAKIDHGNELNASNGKALDLILAAMGLEEKEGEDE